MRDDQKMFIATAVRYGPRSRVGHHCYTSASLISTKAAHPRHAERIIEKLAEQRDGLVRALVPPASPMEQQS